MKGFALRRGAAATIISAAILASGCGNYYRPVANPIPQAGGPLPASAAYGLVVSNTGPNVQGVVTTINLPGDTNQGQFQVGMNPTYAMTPDGTRGLAVSLTEDTLVNYAPINQPLAAISTTVSLAAGCGPSFIASDGTNAYVACPALNEVAIVSLTSNAQIAVVPVGHMPSNLSLSTAHQKLYVTNKGDNTVTVISTKDFSVLATLPVGQAPVFGIEASSIGYEWILNSGDGTVSFLNTTSNTVQGPAIPVGSNPITAAFSAVQRKLFVVNQGSNSVSIINTDPSSPTFGSVATVTVGNNPVGVTALADGSRAFVVNAGSNDVTVIDAAADRVLIPSIPVGHNPTSIGSSPDSSKVIVVNEGDNSVTLIETTHYAVTATVNVIATPFLVNTNQ